MFEAHHPYQYSSFDRRPPRSSAPLVIACLFLLLAGGGLAYLDFQMKASLADLGRELARADGDAARATLDADRSVALASDLQRQLDQAKGQQADMMVKVRSGLAEVANAQRIAIGLQAEVDQARVEESELQAQLGRARAGLKQEQARSAALQTQLDHAGGQASRLGRELAQSRAQAEGLRTELAKAEAPAPAPPPPPVRHPPLERSFKRAGRRFSVRLTNTGPDTLEVAIAVSGANPEAKSSKIKSGSTLDLGKFEPGSRVVVQSPGFDPLSFEVP